MTYETARTHRRPAQTIGIIKNLKNFLTMRGKCDIIGAVFYRHKKNPPQLPEAGFPTEVLVILAY